MKLNNLQKTWLSSKKNDIETQKFNNLLKYFENRKYRFLLMILLNKIREEGNFEISIRKFKQLGKIMKLILKKVKKKDNELMRYIIIMCQTYY